MQNETIADRIRHRRKQLKLTQSKVASHLGIRAASVTMWEAGDTKPNGENLHRLAQFLGSTAEWLLTGKGDVNENVSPGPDIKGLVPLISWVQAGGWNHANDVFQPGEAEEYFPCPVNAGPNTYALKVDGDTMTSAMGKSYPEGCIIYVDPDQTGAVVSGNRVIAKLEGTDQVTFKQLVIDGKRTYLKALNSTYLAITDPFTVLGKVIGKYEPE